MNTTDRKDIVDMVLILNSLAFYQTTHLVFAALLCVH
jgi:hypothetical protein